MDRPNRKLNILMAIPSIRVGGGAEKVSCIVGSALNRYHNLTFLTIRDYSPKYNFNGKYTTLNEKYSNNIILRTKRFISRIWKIKNICKRHKTDIVIAHMEEMSIPSLFSKIFLGNKIKLIIVVHNNPDFKILPYRLIIKYFYKFSNCVIAISKAMEQILIEKYGLKNTQTIYDPQETEKNLEKSREKICQEEEQLFENGFVFINVGRLSEQKGQEFLINAFSKITKKNDRVKLIIIGEGKLKLKLEKMIKNLNLSKNVFLLGRKDNPFPYIKKADCFILSSAWEGFGMVLVEALNMNTPIISTDCLMGPREILAPNIQILEKIKYPFMAKFGILTAPIDSAEGRKSLVEAMKTSLSKKNFYDNMLNRSRDFDINNIIKEWERLIN